MSRAPRAPALRVGSFKERHAKSEVRGFSLGGKRERELFFAFIRLVKGPKASAFSLDASKRSKEPIIKRYIY